MTRNAPPGLRKRVYLTFLVAALVGLGSLLPATAASATTPPAGTQQLAQQILATGRLYGEAEPMAQIQAYANGTIRSVGGRDCYVDTAILQALKSVVVDQGFRLRVSSLNRYCIDDTSGSSATSYHYRNGGGHAIDIDQVNNVWSTGSTAQDISLINAMFQALVTPAGVGQAGCGNRTISLPAGWVQFPDTCNHNHFEYQGTGGTGPIQNTASALSEFGVHGGSWSSIPVGQGMSSAFSVVNMGSGWADIYGSYDGHMQVVTVRNGAWTRLDSGLALNATSIAALNVGQPFPQLLAVESGVIFHVYADSSGWHKMSTGLTTTGKISAVRLPSGEIEAFTNMNGVMYVITSHSGWQMGNSGTSIGDNFKAVLVNGSPQIVTNINGIIHIIWPGAGWQLQSTGQPTSGSLTAVDMGGGYPTIIANEGWTVTVTSVINGAWTRQSTGAGVSGNIDAVNMGGNFPVIYAA
ncbi:MAG: hypothetical protein LBE60_16415 [Microbacterium sp.]|jgi:hypothetical protein|uniref:hypothetical protein n=1 Tax=Microbacterium sp. TaxID=51671 RepID=UPI00283662F5|nr:hypothetical protein [Microbacterium sp.]MDR2323220.1 hypothetical protein [Microbacterium sp.]